MHPGASQPLIAVLGGTGFVGEAFLSAATAIGCRCRLLARGPRPDWPASPLVDVVPLDANSEPELGSALDDCDIVVNLLRPDGTGWHTTVTRCLAGVLSSKSAARYLHVSSIDAYGRTSARYVESDTALEPVSAYEKEHASSEAIASTIPVDVGILRLGAVFGVRGQNLLTMAREMRHAPQWKLAMRRSLYGHRRLYLVGADTVGQALLHLAIDPGALSGGRFLVTEDRDPDNEFAAVQDIFAAAFNRRPLHHVPLLPQAFLQAAMTVRGRSSRDPRRRYSDAALIARGFSPNRPFTTAVRALAEAWATGPDML